MGQWPVIRQPVHTPAHSTCLSQFLQVPNRKLPILLYFTGMNKRLAILAIHGLGCILFLALPYLIADGGLTKLAELPHNPHEQRNVLSYVLAVLFFYLNYFVLIPRFYFRKQYGLYGLCVLCCFLMFWQTLSVVNRGLLSDPGGRLDGLPPPNARYGPPNRPVRPPGTQRGHQPPGLPPEGSQTVFLFVAGGLLSLAVRVNNRLRKTEQEKIQTELSYLKAQINPHFLFNTLNSIYALALVESPATADALVNLSSFLRYVIQDSQQHQVSLRHEIDYIRQYIALQKLRLDDTVQVDFRFDGTVNGQRIAPLLLISFIENAFKYGVSPQEPSAIGIVIAVHDQELTCHITNNKVRVFQPTAVASGIGLANTRARLALLYPRRHQLHISDTADRFTVDLSLILL